MDDTETECTAFQGTRKIASGTRAQVALSVKHAGETHETILIFDDATGRQVEFDLRGSDAEIVARLSIRASRASRGGRSLALRHVK